MFGLRFVEVTHRRAANGDRRVESRCDVPTPRASEIEELEETVTVYHGKVAFADPVAALHAATSIVECDFLDRWPFEEVASAVGGGPAEVVSRAVGFAILALGTGGERAEPVFVCDCDGVIVLDRIAEYV